VAIGYSGPLIGLGGIVTNMRVRRSERMPSFSLKSVAVAAAQVAITVVLLVAIVKLLDLDKIKSIFENTAPSWLTLAVGIFIAQQVFAAERWRLIGAALSVPHHSFSFYLFWQGAGMLCSMVLPSVVGADLARTYALSRRTQIGTVVRVLLVDRALGLLALAALVTSGFLIFPSFFIDNPLMLVALGIAVSGIVIYFVMTRWLSNTRSENPIITFARQVGRDLRHTFEGIGALRVIAASLSIHLLSILLFLILGKAIGLRGVDFIHFWVIVSSAILITVIPISIGGWGLRESAFIFGFGLIAVEPEKAFALSVMFGLLSTMSALVATLCGLGALFRSTKRAI